MHLDSCLFSPSSEVECCFGWFPQAEPCWCFSPSFLFNCFQLYVQWLYGNVFKRVCVLVCGDSHVSGFMTHPSLRGLGIDIALSSLLVSSCLISRPRNCSARIAGQEKALPSCIARVLQRLAGQVWRSFTMKGWMFGVPTFAQNVEVFAAALFGWKDQDFEPQQRENNVEKSLQRSWWLPARTFEISSCCNGDVELSIAIGRSQALCIRACFLIKAESLPRVVNRCGCGLQAIIAIQGVSEAVQSKMDLAIESCNPNFQLICLKFPSSSFVKLHNEAASIRWRLGRVWSSRSRALRIRTFAWNVWFQSIRLPLWSGWNKLWNFDVYMVVYILYNDCIM